MPTKAILGTEAPSHLAPPMLNLYCSRAPGGMPIMTTRGNLKAPGSYHWKYTYMIWKPWLLDAFPLAFSSFFSPTFIAYLAAFIVLNYILHEALINI